MSSKNENCLAGFKCPNCGQEDKFYIDATATFVVTDDGTEVAKGADVGWEDENWCMCYDCHHKGPVKIFCTEEVE